ncbi:MAG: AmmeMemoRadiSam system protein B [Candidatus Zixiibacteriota bacterium]|nr:MAG: AmmeMemoRadiSam system protein B [candidate division Zixibacteria bacterium]
MKQHVVFLAVVVAVIVAGSGASAATRLPAVAGAFYPSDSAELATMVSGHLAGVRDLPEIDGQIIALIVPHAGLVYSGQIAAYGYKLLETAQMDNVVLCGPSHRFGFEGISVYGPGVKWKTPLGIVACSDRLCEQMIAFDKNISAIPEAHEIEHCLEVQLPYLQTTLKQFEIVPVLMGYPDESTTEVLAGALAKLDPGGKTVLIASTDWQHYRPASAGWKLDSVGIDCIKRLDHQALQSYLGARRTEACGGAAAVAVTKAAKARGANKVKILKYGDSGDVSGDKSGVVGYVAAVLYKSGSDNPKSTSPAPDEDAAKTSEVPAKFELTDTERGQLLKIARASIEHHLARKPLPEFDATDKLREPGAAFVTLTKGGQLRGCIGYTMAFAPLVQTVSECAIKAAVQDPRFPPVTADEVPELHIEISVLTPLQPVTDLDEIEVGRDGLMITMGRNRGLLLPQVASGYGWTREEFLQQTCRKAGLPPDAYKSMQAIIEKFQAVIFDEPE